MKKLWVLVLLVLFGIGCTVSQKTAERVLEGDGLHNVTLTGYSFFSCSDDKFNSGFIAYRTVMDTSGGMHEQRVEGVLCCGMWQSCIVRH